MFVYNMILYSNTTIVTIDVSPQEAIFGAKIKAKPRQ